MPRCAARPSGAGAFPGTAVVDPKDVARDWKSRGFGCETWVDAPGQRWEDFVHDTDELVVVLEGEMEFEIEGVTHRPPRGVELFIPARTRHSARNVGAVTARWLFGYRQARDSRLGTRNWGMEKG